MGEICTMGATPSDQELIAAFVERRRENEKIERKDNSQLHAGSAMYYYCRHCEEVDIKSEDFDPRYDPIKNPCNDCKVLIKRGLMEAAKAAMLPAGETRDESGSEDRP
jgi:hypothetical protein